MPLTIGVEMVDMRSKAKATRKRRVSGVAGRTMIAFDMVLVAVEELIRRVVLLLLLLLPPTRAG